jgi:beta-galactosidase
MTDLRIRGCLLLLAAVAAGCLAHLARAADSPRTRTLVTADWRFTKGDAPGVGDTLAYNQTKNWVLPTGNSLLKDPARHARRPEGNLGEGVVFIVPAFDDSAWERVDLPHDSAIAGPFSRTGGGGMGRLPTAGVTWYRKRLAIPASAAGKSLFLDFDGAMSYSLVWLNGRFVGGWPFGYSSFRLDITPYANPGGENVLAVRLDNPPASSRWYPGAGIYRNVWLVETSPAHVGQWGTYITTPDVTPQSATVVLQVTVDNTSAQNANVEVGTEIYELAADDQKTGPAVATMAPRPLAIAAGRSATLETRGTVANPRLWGTGKTQKPNRYMAVTTIRQAGRVVDVYETPFGIRTLRFDPARGFFLNGEHILIHGVNNHHDLGALGAAFNVRAAQRQLEILQEMGGNALRTSHNPPAPELLDLCDKMGILVMDEAFDCWAARKTTNDYALLFADWHEQDLRAMLRRDRNHPSIIFWSIGNEVGEQSNDRTGIAAMLTAICHDEDPTRPTISGMNAARADSPFARPLDAIGLNYQGAGLNPVLRPPGTPQYPLYRQTYPDKLIVGTETASTVSSRGFYAFPVATGLGTAAVRNGAGVVAGVRQVSSYDMYHADWAMVPDKEFAARDRWPFVAGEFVWTGFDYLGEPTPFDQSRSSYFGIIDLAGFKKDRFYLYQSYWRPDLPMAHILPHWNWPERVGQVTPVHVYTSGDEAELLLNGRSLGRKKKGPQEYRLRWDDVVYEPGEVRVVAYKAGAQWATAAVKTTGEAAQLLLSPDRATIAGDGRDLSFVTVTVADREGLMVPRADNLIQFSITGPGEIVATDNGDPTDMTAFPSRDRNAFNGLALAIVRAKPGQSGDIMVTAKAQGLPEAKVTITAR